MSSEGPLPRRLTQVLAAMADRDFAAKLERVFLVAANAIEKLGDLNLLNYEVPAEEDAPDLSLWEQMAPLVRDTVIEVNKLVGEIGDVFGSGDRPAPKDRSEALAVEALHRASREISEEIARFGETMRSPSIVSDRWALLTEAQAFRTRFRTRIGKMVHETAGAFEDVDAPQVVPGLGADTRAAVELRVAVTDLARLVVRRERNLRDLSGTEVLASFQQLCKELDAFGRTKAYRGLRAQDKRQFVEFRHAAAKLDRQASASREQILAAVEPFSEFVGTLARVNERRILIDHDRELQAALSIKMEQVDAAIDRDPETATALFLEASKEIRELYGRDSAVDQFIRALRKRPDEGFDVAELRQGVAAFRGLLAKLSIE